MKFENINTLIEAAGKQEILFDLAREMSGFYDITIDDINDIYEKPSDLLNDTTNIIEVCKEADEKGFEHIWLSGSVYDYDFWVTGSPNDHYEAAAEALCVFDLERLTNSYNELKKEYQ